METKKFGIEIPCSFNKQRFYAHQNHTLPFRWKAAKLKDDTFDDESYIGVMANCVWQLRQHNERLMYRVLSELTTDQIDSYYNRIRIKIAAPKVAKRAKKVKLDETCTFHNKEYYEDLLNAYFRLEVDLKECYQQWATAHKHFESLSCNFSAIRVLDQDPIENLFSFICSQNNHISRYFHIFYPMRHFLTKPTTIITSTAPTNILLM